jgi:hypothetical protein
VGRGDWVLSGNGCVRSNGAKAKAQKGAVQNKVWCGRYGAEGMVHPHLSG